MFKDKNKSLLVAVATLLVISFITTPAGATLYEYPTYDDGNYSNYYTTNTYSLSEGRDYFRGYGNSGPGETVTGWVWVGDHFVAGQSTEYSFTANLQLSAYMEAYGMSDMARIQIHWRLFHVGIFGHVIMKSSTFFTRYVSYWTSEHTYTFDESYITASSFKDDLVAQNTYCIAIEVDIDAGSDGFIRLASDDSDKGYLEVNWIGITPNP